MGCSPWDCQESDTTEHTHTVFYLMLEYVSPWGQIGLSCPCIPHFYTHSAVSSSAHLLCSSSHSGVYRIESSPEALGGLLQRGWKTVSLRTVWWGHGSGQTLNLAKLKGTRYGKRKCCGLEQSGMVTVDLNQMSILTRKHSCCLFNPIVVEEICCFSHLHIPLSYLLNDSKHIFMR